MDTMTAEQASAGAKSHTFESVWATLDRIAEENERRKALPRGSGRGDPRAGEDMAACRLPYCGLVFFLTISQYLSAVCSALFSPGV
jgi:hypothetical protein